MKSYGISLVFCVVTLIAGCGGGGGGSGGSSGGETAGSSSSGNGGKTSAGAVILPAVQLSGQMSTIQLDIGQPAVPSATPSAAVATPTVLAQNMASVAENILVIDGVSWKPVCASNAGVTHAAGSPSISIDRACLSDLTVLEVSTPLINGAQAKAKLHAVVTSAQILQSRVAITPLTDLAFADVHLALAAGRPVAEIVSQLDTVAKRLIRADVNGDTVIDYNDLLAWRPALGQSSLRIDLSSLYDAYINQTDAGIAAASAVSSASLGVLQRDTSNNPIPITHLVSSGANLYALLSNGVVDALDGLGNLAWSANAGAGSSIVTANGNFLAVAAGSVLKIAALPSTQAPSFITLDLGATINDIALQGSQAFVATTTGVQTINIGSPLTVAAATTAAIGSRIAVGNNALYLASNGVLTVFSIQSDGSLIKTSAVNFAYPFLNVSHLVSSGNNLFMAAGPAGILHFDVTNSAAPVEKARFYEGASSVSMPAIYDIQWRNNALLAEGDTGLQLISIDAAGVLSASGRLYIAGINAGSGVAAIGDSFYFSTSTGALNVSALDAIANNNWLIGRLSVPDAKSFAIASNVAYIGTSPSDGTNNAKVVAIDISNPANLAVTRSYDVSGFIFDITLHGTIAALANTTWGYETLDLQTGQVNRYDYMSGTAVGLTNYGNYDLVYNRSGYAVFDATKPTAPTLLNLYDRGNDSDSEAGVIIGSTLLEARGHYGLDVIPLGTAATPQTYTNINTTDGLGWQGELHAWSLTLQNNQLFVAGCGTGLFVLDVTMPTKPKVLSNVAVGQCASSIAVKDNMAYVMDTDAATSVFDVTDASNPLFVGTFPSIGPAINGWITNNTFYVIDQHSLSALPTVRALPASVVQ